MVVSSLNFKSLQNNIINFNQMEELIIQLLTTIYI